jgi:hypothetical protein
MRRLAGGLPVVALVAALVAALIAPASAAAADETLLASGTVTYTWHGDPSRGCAAAGLCDVQGALIINPQGSADAQSERGRTFINLDAATPTVRVLTGSGECIDSPESGGGPTVTVDRGGDGRLVGRIESPLSSGRCAGPAAQDLSGLALPVRKTGGKDASYDLRTTLPLVSGPFSGALVSTLVLRPSGIEEEESSSGSSGSVPPPPRHKVLIERVTLRYAVTPLAGGLEIPFSGESDPSCTALDSCGATGTLVLSPGGPGTALTLTASRTVRRRVGARGALADLRRGRLGPPSGFGRVSSLNVAETYSGAGISRCDASAEGPGAGLSVGGQPGTAPRGSATRVTLFASGDEYLRTYCPGPSTADVTGRFESLGQASVTVAQLLAPQSDLLLTDPGSFSGIGYVGTRTDGIGFSLALEGIRAGTVQEEQR